jgi:hypothetical protein
MRKLKVKKSIAMTLVLALGIAIIVFVTMLLFNLTDYGITLASFAASIFMILSKKDIKKRAIFGSYLVATLMGFMFSNLSQIRTLNVALAAVSSVILMTFLDLQHTPAVGMSISLVLNNFAFMTDILILFCILLILAMTLTLKIIFNNPTKIIRFIEVENDKIEWNFKEKKMPSYLKMKDPTE